MSRIISKKFINELKEGILSNLLKVVINDETLELEIRKDYINIYYRGGSLLKIVENDDNYKFFFDENYILKEYKALININLPQIKKVTTKEDVDIWIETIPYLKQHIDFWLNEKKLNSKERESQQLLERENNAGKTPKSKDYIICDIEYAIKSDNDEDYRFDVIAINKDSSGNDLCIMELKYGDGAIKSESGIIKHIKDIYTFLSNKDRVKEMKEDIIFMYNTKRNLGLLRGKEITELNDDYKVLLVFIDHNPQSSILKNELEKVIKREEYKKLISIAKVKISMSYFMGYGLYDERIISIEDFLNNNY